MLAATENNGLWRSTDSGRTFAKVAVIAEQVNAVLAAEDVWYLSDASGIWKSADGIEWQQLPSLPPALALIATEQGVWAGGEHGVFAVQAVG